jgi:hypothetical protein
VLSVARPFCGVLILSGFRDNGLGPLKAAS